MNRPNRRAFLQFSSGAVAATLSGNALAFRNPAISVSEASTIELGQIKRLLPENEGKKPLRLGLIIAIGKDPDEAMARVRQLGLPTCQVYVEDFRPELAGKLRQALNKHRIEATSLVVGGPGKEEWDFYRGPVTIGIVPRETRAARMAHIKNASEFAKQCGIAAVQTHCGFIPENPNDPLYSETVAALRELVAYCQHHGQNFPPITLVRAMRDVGLENQGVNFDLANLILYGKGNPVDAMEILGPYVQGIHAKDGMWPTNPRELGQEVSIGKGRVDFPKIIDQLRKLDYRGAITIEREISGARQLQDVREAKAYLEKLIG